MLWRKNKLKKVLSWFILWRILLFVPLLLSLLIPKNTQFSFNPNDTSILAALLNPWANFDGVHYLSIATSGYTFDGRFFPLYPFLIYILSFGSDGIFQLVVALLISGLSFLLGLIIFHKILLEEYGQNIAKWAVIFLLVFPTSFFFAGVYSESLFFFLLMLTFLMLNRKKWIFASLSSFFLIITRPVGICILPVLLLEYLQNYRKEKVIGIKNLLAVILSPLGLVVYSLYNKKKWGDYLYFIHAQGQLSNSRSTAFIFFPQTIFRYFKILSPHAFSQFEWWIAVLEFASFLLGVTLLILSWKKVKSSYLFFSILTLLIPTSTGTFSGLPRYILLAFPIFITLAKIFDSKSKIIYLSFLGVLLVVLTALFLRGYYIA